MGRRSSLAAHLIHGTSETAEVERQAAFLGVDLAVPRAVCLFSLEGTPASFDGRTVAAAVARRAPELDAFATSVTEGAALCLDLPAELPPEEADAKLKTVARKACEDLLAMGPIAVAISDPCLAAGDYPAAYAAAQQTLRCVVRFCPPGERPAVLTVRDVGAARLFLASTDRNTAAEYARQTFASLLNARRSREELMLTLDVYVRECSSIKRAAEVLTVHENTVRYRLGRVEELTGYSFANADDVMRIRLALKILELEAVGSPDAVELSPAT